MDWKISSQNYAAYPKKIEYFIGIKNSRDWASLNKHSFSCLI